MHNLNELCSLCLVHDLSVLSQIKIDPNAREVLEFVLPKFTFLNVEIPKQICEDCLNMLHNIHEFKQKCIKNVAAYLKYFIESNKDNDTNANSLWKKIDNLPNEKGKASEESEDFETICDVEFKNKIYRREFINATNELDLQNEAIQTELKQEIVETEDNVTVKQEIEEVTIKEEILSCDDQVQNNYLEVNKIIQEHSYSTLENSVTADGADPLAVPNNIENSDPAIQNESLENQFDCKRCSKKFDSEMEYIAHIVNRIYKCQKCQRVYHNLGNLRKHLCLKKSAKSNRKNCKKKADPDYKICNATSSKSNDLEGPKCNTRNRKPSCKVEPNNQNNRKLFPKVVQLQTCKICNITFPESNYLKIHKCIKRKPSNKPIPNSNLSNCKLDKKIDQPYMCDICNVGFSRNMDLNKHKHVHIGQIYRCGVCQKIFTTLDALDSHKNVHSSRTIYIFINNFLLIVMKYR